jgi:hypothetical protein
MSARQNLHVTLVLLSLCKACHVGKSFCLCVGSRGFFSCLFEDIFASIQALKGETKRPPSWSSRRDEIMAVYCWGITL